MRTIKQKIFAALAALLFATLMLSAVFLSLFKPFIIVNAIEPTASANTIVDDIVDSSGDVDKANFKDLVYKLSGKGVGGKWQDILDLVSGAVTKSGDGIEDGLPTALNAAQICEKVGGLKHGTSELVIKFADKYWNPVYLTRDRDDNVILDLWLTDTTDKQKWAAYSNSTSRTLAYPSNYYESSIVRSFLTGTSKYSTNGSALDSGPLTSPWSDFNTAGSKFGQWLVTPARVAYQEKESWADLDRAHGWHTLPNEAYGAPFYDNYGVADNNYQNKDGYGSWKNDLLWLPSLLETGRASGVNSTTGIWSTSIIQRRNGSSTSNVATETTWTRTSDYESGKSSVICSLNGTGYTSSLSQLTECYVRPALHLNLSALAKAAGIVKLTSDSADDTITEDYDGTAKEIVLTGYDTSALDFTITSEPYENINGAATFDTSSGKFSATNAGVYTLKVTLKSGHEFADINDNFKEFKITINPAKITIQSSKQNELNAGYDYVYHTDGGGTHALKFPAANEADYIDLNAVDSGGSDKASLKIFYYIQTHDEKDHQNFVENTLPEIEKTLETLPDLSDGGDAKTGWVKYAADNASLNVNDVQGYCVFYKVTADNHKTLYGHFSVHIATEELKIYTDGNPLTESPVEFGSPDVPHKQEDLKKLAEAIITGVQDQNGEPRLDSLDKTKFVFYLKNRDTGDEVHTIEDSGGEARWNAGTYELWVKYVDEGKSQFINFTWNSARPTLTIKPQEITLTWKGNDNWETDSAGASETVRDMDEFSWVYDGSSHNPTASFVDKYKETIKPAVTITGEYINAQSYTATAPDVANYTFTNKTQTFKIVKAKNGWKDGKGYDRGDWSVGGKIAQEYVPEDLFGNTAKVYYYKAYSKEDGFSQQYTGDFSDIKEPTVFYVQILIEPDNDNYDGIEEMKSFQITVCTRHEAKAGEYGHNEQGHWTICKFCGEQIESEPQPHAAEDGAGYSSDGSQHWQTCKTCGVEFGRENHIAKEGDGALGHDSSQHWNICQTCNETYDKVAHSYTIEGNITKYPNCTESGTKQYKCVCGEIEERDIDPTGHTAKAGWQSDGSRHWQVCSTCSEIIEESRKNHSWAYTPQVDPKCTAPGHTEFWKCSDCEKLREDCKDEDIDPIPHTFGAEKERREPTCTQPGSETGMCTMCQNRVTNILPATGHSYAEKIERAATCTLAGSKIEECTACHEMKPDSRVSIPMTEHTYGTWNTLLAATCEDSGTDQHACTACGHKEERTVQPLGHSMQRHAQKDATETAAGNIEYYECSKCHKYYDSPTGGIPLSATDIVIPALGSGNMSTGGGGDDGFFKNNWWWIMLIALAILIILLIVWIISSSRARRRERERDRQFEALLKMQMMHYGFGMGGYQNAAENDAAFTEKQQPAQLPYTQEMIDVAVAAAMSAMQRMNASKPDGGNPPHDDNNGGGESANDGGGNGGNGGGDDDGFVDDFGFYDEYKP